MPEHDNERKSKFLPTSSRPRFHVPSHGHELTTTSFEIAPIRGVKQTGTRCSFSSCEVAMSDDAPADPSLLLVQHDTAHREHRHRDHRDLHHQHHRFHKRDAAAGTGVVTEIIATVSVVQQIDVDSAGNTYSTLLHPTSPPSSLALTDILTDGATHASSDASMASGVTSHAASAATPPSTLLSSIDSAQSPLHASSDASAPTAAHSSTFASTHVPVNSTSCKL